MVVGGRTTDHRRGKSALFLIGCGWAGMAPHWLHDSLRLIPALTLAVLLGFGRQPRTSSSLRRSRG